MQRTYARIAVAVVGVIIILVGGYYIYRYIKFTPPDFLVKLVTLQKTAPPLPEGDRAPLIAAEGFTATIFSREVPGARVMVRDQKGTMLVSLTQEGRVVALPDLDNNGKADRTVPVLAELKEPHGLVVACPDTGNVSADQDACILYVAETDALKAYQYDADTYKATYQKTLATLPSGSGHYTRTLLLSPEGNTLLVSIGSSCNVCSESDARRASVQEVDLATGEMRPFATGLRNTVFMTTHPITGKIWGTDNGRDLLGDDIPPDEVNIIVRGKNYGWPYCYGQNVHDTDFDVGRNVQRACAGKATAFIDLPAHAAALGLAFIPGDGWPTEWRHDLLVAYHGSWNRSEPVGYKVVRFDFQKGVTLPVGTPADFLTGFLPAGGTESDSIGRPVGILAEPNGVVYISDDRAGAIYLVTLDSQ